MFKFLSPRSTAHTAHHAWMPQHLLQLFPGAALCCVIAMAATLVSTLHGGPQFLYALFFGVAFHYLSHDATTRPGIEFCSRTVLRLASACSVRASRRVKLQAWAGALRRSSSPPS